jgi:hypothetical protein
MINGGSGEAGMSKKDAVKKGIRNGCERCGSSVKLRGKN